MLLMNPHTGSVDTEENWAAEGYTTENSTLVEVVMLDDGSYEEEK